MPKKEIYCPVEIILGIIGGRWKVLIIYYLLKRTMRFNELQKNLHGITHRTLTRQLREMELHGLIIRKDFNETPLRAEYSFSSLGRSLEHILQSMDAWDKEYDNQYRKDFS